MKWAGNDRIKKLERMNELNSSLSSITSSRLINFSTSDSKYSMYISNNHLIGNVIYINCAINYSDTFPTGIYIVGKFDIKPSFNKYLNAKCIDANSGLYICDAICIIETDGTIKISSIKQLSQPTFVISGVFIMNS